MRILITGSTGFLGGSLGRVAARAGHEVIGTGRSSEPTNDCPGSYSSSDGSAESICEIANASSPDIVFHGAGTASVSASLQDPIQDFEGSVVTCANLLEGIRRSDCRPLIFIPSSAAIYGNADSLPIGESAPSRPISPYGVHKSMCETLARGWAEAFGLPIIVCRLFSVFGPTQRRLLIWELFNQFSGPTDAATIEGTGSESRDFLYVDDVADAVLRLAGAPESRAPGYFEIVNMASGEETTVATLANHIRDLVAPGKQIHYRGLVRPGDPSNWRADTSKLTSMIPGWRPRRLLDALDSCVQSWQEASVFQHGA